jgi:hypothetical protein
VSIWRGIFAREKMLGWEFVAWALAILIGSGVAMIMVFTGFDLALGATVCFSLAAMIMLTKIVELAVVSTGHPFWERGIFVFVLFGFIGVGSTELIRWIYLNRPIPPSTTPAAPPAAQSKLQPEKSNAIAPTASHIPPLPPIAKSLRFTTVLPLADSSKNVPIPMNTNSEDSKADFYRDLVSLTIRPDQPPPGITYRERKLDSLEDKFLFVNRLMQYYVLHSLRVLQRGRQGTKWAAGKGVTVIDVNPIVTPDGVPYPTDALIHALGDNEFLNQLERVLWTTRPFYLPRGTTISLSEKQPKDRPLECTVRLERPRYYRLDFVVSPGIGMQGQPPAGFQTPMPNVSSYAVTLTMNYEVQRQGDGFEPETYAQWAEDLFSGLKNIMAP